MIIVVGISATVLLAVAAVGAIVRMERGPSMLDRTVAFDVLTTALVGAIVVEAAISRRTESVPILVVLSMVGFIGSVAISRFAATEPAGSGPSGGSDGNGSGPGDEDVENADDTGSPDDSRDGERPRTGDASMVSPRRERS